MSRGRFGGRDGRPNGTLTIEQAAAVLGIGRSTAYELVHSGDLPSLRLGRRIVVPVARLAELLAPPVTVKDACHPEPEVHEPADRKGDVASEDRATLF